MPYLKIINMGNDLAQAERRRTEAIARDLTARSFATATARDTLGKRLASPHRARGIFLYLTEPMHNHIWTVIRSP